MIRLFAAVPVPDEIAAALVRRQQGLEGARWRTPEQMHVTLRFFGEIREDWYPLYEAPFAAMEKPLGALVGQPRPASPAPPAPLSTYVGTYANPYYGPARVTATDGGLSLAIGPKLVVPLRHWDGNVFTFSFVSENSVPGSISKATFDGNRLTLEYYDSDGMGTFTR